MPRGGTREGAGRKSAWVNSETTVIRVPKVFASRLLEIAQRLDKGELIELVTKSKGFEASENIEPESNNDFVTNSTKFNSNEVAKSEWMTTKEAWVLLGKPKAWNTFRKLKPHILRAEFSLEVDPSRKIRGRTDSRWMRLIKEG